jgi:hypothetical protein
MWSSIPMKKLTPLLQQILQELVYEKTSFYFGGDVN